MFSGFAAPKMEEAKKSGADLFGAKITSEPKPIAALKTAEEKSLPLLMDAKQIAKHPEDEVKIDLKATDKSKDVIKPQ